MHCGHALNTADEFIKGKCYECQKIRQCTVYGKELGKWWRGSKVEKG